MCRVDFRFCEMKQDAMHKITSFFHWWNKDVMHTTNYFCLSLIKQDVHIKQINSFFHWSTFKLYCILFSRYTLFIPRLYWNTRDTLNIPRFYWNRNSCLTISQVLKKKKISGGSIPKIKNYVKKDPWKPPKVRSEV